MTVRIRGSRFVAIWLFAGVALLALAMACGGEKEVIERTVVVERQVPVEKKVVETVIVEKQVPGEKVVQTVVVEKQVPGEKVVQTVVVERPVEKVVVQTVQVERVVEKVVAATPPAGGPRSDIRVASRQVLDLPGAPFDAPYSAQWSVNGLGVSETLFVKRGDNIMSPQLATTWELAADGKKVTIATRKGVPWVSPVGEDKNFGTFTAADAVWWLNQANANTNKGSTYKFAGTLAGAVSKTVLVDENTFQLLPASDRFDPITIQDILSEWAHGSEMFSKAVFEKAGLEWMKRNVVGTGPMRVEQVVINDRLSVVANPDHYLHPSKWVRKLTIIQVPEPQSRTAMLRNGSVEVTDVPLTVVGDLEKAGFKFLNPMNQLTTASLTMPGNLWERNHAITGAPLNPWDSTTYAVDYPHIGDPWQELEPTKVRYKDTNNPAGMSDMEQARLVRQALNFAIDKEGMLQELWGNRGFPIPVEYVGPEFEAWEAGRTVDRAKMTAIFKKYGLEDVPSAKHTGPFDDMKIGWKDKFDRALAEKILDAAGYPRKAGVRFEMQIDAYQAGELGGTPFEASDVIATMWEAIGVRTQINKGDYGAVISPRMVRREQVWPVPKNCDVEETSYPADWFLPVSDTSITRPGWGCGFEAQFLSLMNLKMRGMLDRAQRVEAHKDVLDWMIFNRLYVGISELPISGFMVNPKKIIDWTSRQRSFGSTEFFSIVTSD